MRKEADEDRITWPELGEGATEDSFLSGQGGKEIGRPMRREREKIPFFVSFRRVPREYLAVESFVESKASLRMQELIAKFKRIAAIGRKQHLFLEDPRIRLSLNLSYGCWKNGRRLLPRAFYFPKHKNVCTRRCFEEARDARRLPFFFSFLRKECRKCRTSDKIMEADKLRRDKTLFVHWTYN